MSSDDSSKPDDDLSQDEPSSDASGGQTVLRVVLLLLVVVVVSVWFFQFGGQAKYQPSPEVRELGSVEASAKLVEIPGKFLPNDNFYNYAFVMKYELVEVHRGKVETKQIYVAHYNPLKLRSEAADDTLDNVGGGLERFQVGDVHRLALDSPIDDHYIGGIINRFAKKGTKPGLIYWARWTEKER